MVIINSMVMSRVSSQTKISLLLLEMEVTCFFVASSWFFSFSACQVVGCLLLFCSWSFSTLLLAFSFAGDDSDGDDGDGDDSDNCDGNLDIHDGDGEG